MLSADAPSAAGYDAASISLSACQSSVVACRMFMKSASAKLFHPKADGKHRFVMLKIPINSIDGEVIPDGNRADQEIDR